MRVTPDPKPDPRGHDYETTGWLAAIALIRLGAFIGLVLVTFGWALPTLVSAQNDVLVILGLAAMPFCLGLAAFYAVTSLLPAALDLFARLMGR